MLSVDLSIYQDSATGVLLPNQNPCKKIEGDNIFAYVYVSGVSRVIVHEVSSEMEEGRYGVGGEGSVIKGK